MEILNCRTRKQCSHFPLSVALEKKKKKLWVWCLHSNISLQATHLAGVQNITADEESRVMKDWMLCPRVFNKINRATGPLQVGLSASRLTHQLCELETRPRSMGNGCLHPRLETVSRARYANPPWNLVGRVLAQVRDQEAQLVLVAPVWKSQVWYPTLLGMTVQEPLLLPSIPDLIQPTHRVNKPDITPTSAMWVISGRDSGHKAFLKELQNSFWRHGIRKQQSHTTPCLRWWYTPAIMIFMTFFLVKYLAKGAGTEAK